MAAAEDAAIATPSRDAIRARAVELLLILVSGLGFASFYLAVDRAHAAGGGVWWTLAGVRGAALVAMGLVAVLFARGRTPSQGISRRLLVFGALSGGGDTGGNLCYILARSVGTLSTTVVLVSLYPVSTALLARLLLGERLSRMRLAGVALAVAGAALIGLGATLPAGG